MVHLMNWLIALCRLQLSILQLVPQYQVQFQSAETGTMSHNVEIKLMQEAQQDVMFTAWIND